MHVCLLNDSFPPQIDGVANTVINYAHVLHKNGDDVAVAVPSHPKVVDDYPFSVVRYPSLDATKLCGYRAGMPFYPETIGKLKKFQPEIIHSHCPIISTYLARTLRGCTDVPIVFTYHTKFDVDIARAIRFNFLQDRAIHLLVKNIAACNEVWVVSQGAGENLRSLGYKGDYIVMENGVEFPSGRVSQETLDRLTEQYHLPVDGRPIFLFVGRMMWYKGLRTTLDALAGVKAAGKDFYMVLIGDGADRQEIMDYAKELGLEDRCLFTGAIRDREALRAWYCRCDLFLFASTYDTNGIVVREAAACSLPSLLIRGSCAAEGVTHLRSGLLIADDAREMSATLLKYAFDRFFLRQIGDTATKELYLSWEDSVLRARARYELVLDRYRSGLYPTPQRDHDERFELIGDVLSGLEKARLFRENIQNGLRRFL